MFPNTVRTIIVTILVTISIIVCVGMHSIWSGGWIAGAVMCVLI